MNHCYMGYHLDNFGIEHLHKKKKEGKDENVRSQPTFIFCV